jgi:hypothetical protein
MSPGDQSRKNEERAAEERPVPVLRTWVVTAKGWGHVSTRRVQATSRKEAEERVLADVGFSVESQEASR